MQPKIRLYSGALFLLVLLPVLTGCNRHPAQTSQALNSTSQPSVAADQQDPNQAPEPAKPDAGATSPPTMANSTASPATAQPYAPAQSNPPHGAVQGNASNAAPPALIIPAGTSVTVRLQQSLSSASAVPGQRFEAVLDQPLVVENQVIAPVGTPVTGHVVVARRSGRFHHPGEIGLTLDNVVLGQQQIPIRTSSVVARGASHKKRNWGLIGGGTGGGALIGALAGGGKGALIGGGIGAAAGTTTALLTGKKDVTFGAERRLTFRLHRDVSLQSS
jgi:hypothetical protein